MGEIARTQDKEEAEDYWLSAAKKAGYNPSMDLQMSYFHRFPWRYLTVAQLCHLENRW